VPRINFELQIQTPEPDGQEHPQLAGAVAYEPGPNVPWLALHRRSLRRARRFKSG